MDSPQEPGRNWAELPCDVMELIFQRLGTIEMLTNAQYVCSYWRTICNQPSMWRSIDMRFMFHFRERRYDYGKIYKHAVDKSAGGLLDIYIEHFATDDRLMDIAYRSSHLRCLRLVSCLWATDGVLILVASKLPFLEELEFSCCPFSEEVLKAFGRCCPLLRSFKLNFQGYELPHIECNKEAIAIAETMPGLCHLQIVGNKLTNDGLQAILNGCPNLVSLDLRRCFNVNLEGHLGEKCAERIKDLRYPYDSTHDYPYYRGEETYPPAFPASSKVCLSDDDYSDDEDNRDYKRKRIV